MKVMQVRTLLLLFILYAASTAMAQITFREGEFTIEKEGVPLRKSFAGGLHSGQFFLMDINGDEEEDLVVFDRAGDVVKTLIYADGNYTFNADYASLFPENLQNWVYLADYNCDGKKDLFTYSSFGVRVFTNISGQDELPEWELTHDPLFTISGSSSVNLLVNPSDIPAIADVDQDGDIDILAFNFASGETVNLYENLRMDNDGNCGLSFARTNQRWGDFSECFCGNYAFGENSCSSGAGRTMHIGGKTLLLPDLNGDNLPEIIIGEEDCEELTVFTNVGTADEAVFEEADSLFTVEERPYSGAFFPSAFSGDFNKDGSPDLIISSNHREDLLGLDYTRSVFLMANNATAGTQAFSDPVPFLQNEMFDVGENAVPVFFDANGDGRPDLLVANKGLPANNEFAASVTLLLNKGNNVFELADSNWMELRTLGLTNLSLQLADIDGDGRADLVLKGFGLNTFGLRILWIPNRSNSFDPADAAVLNLSINATDNPYFHDVNRDGKLDVLLGQSNGRLSLWLNSGTNTAPAYNANSDPYLGINLNPDRTFLVPVVANEDGNSQPDLLLADNSGGLRLINDFAASAGDPLVVQVYNETFSTTGTLSAGRRIWPAMADLNGDNALELVVGTAQGGLYLYSETDKAGNPTDGVKLLVNMYPNPLQETRTLSISSNLPATGLLYNLSGQQLGQELILPNGELVQIALGHLPTGLYFLRVKSGTQLVTKKLIIGL